MPASTPPPAALRAAWPSGRLALLALWLAPLGLLLLRATTLRLEHFDGVENIQTALRLWGVPWAEASPNRTALPPLLLALPALPFARGWSDDPYHLPHLASVLIGVLGAGACARLARCGASARAALLAVALLVLCDRLTLYYVPLAMSAAPALLTVALALLLVSRAGAAPSSRSALLAGVAVGLACATRHQCLLLGPAVVAWWLAGRPLARGPRAPLAPGALATLGVTAVATWVGCYALVALACGEASGAAALASGVRRALRVLGNANALVVHHRAGPGFYLQALPAAAGWGGVLLLGVGAGRALARRSALDLLLLGWAGLYLLGISVTPSREARYLVPLLPAAAALAALALDPLLRRLRDPVPRVRLGAALLLLLLLADALTLAAGEALSWRDPFWRRDPMARLATEVARRREGAGGVAWSGDPWSVYPATPSPFPDDPYHLVLALGRQDLGLRLRAQVRLLSRPAPAPPWEELRALPEGSVTVLTPSLVLADRRPTPAPPARVVTVEGERLRLTPVPTE